MPHWIPSDQRLHRRDTRVCDNHNFTTFGQRNHHGSSRHPASERFLGGTKIGPAEQCPTVEQERGAVAAGHHRLRTHCRDHQRGPVWQFLDHVTAPGQNNFHTGKRPPEFFGGPAGTDHHRAQRFRPARVTSVGGIGNPAPAARRCPGAVGTCRSGKSQWAVTPTAPCRGTALSAGQGRYVPPPRHLHQDSVALTQSAPGGRECNSGQTSRSGSRIAGQGLIAVGKRGDLGCVGTNDVPRSDQIVRPSRVDEYLRFCRTGEPTDHDGAPGDVATQDGNFAGMWIRRPRLGQVVVAVVPDDDKTGLGASAQKQHSVCRRRSGRSRAVQRATSDIAWPAPGPRTDLPPHPLRRVRYKRRRRGPGRVDRAQPGSRIYHLPLRPRPVRPGAVASFHQATPARPHAGFSTREWRTGRRHRICRDANHFRSVQERTAARRAPTVPPRPSRGAAVPPNGEHRRGFRHNAPPHDRRLARFRPSGPARTR